MAIYLEMLIDVLWEKKVSAVPENISRQKAPSSCAVKQSAEFCLNSCFQI